MLADNELTLTSEEAHTLHENILLWKWLKIPERVLDILSYDKTWKLLETFKSNTFKILDSDNWFIFDKMFTSYRGKDRHYIVNWMSEI